MARSPTVTQSVAVVAALAVSLALIFLGDATLTVVGIVLLIASVLGFMAVVRSTLVEDERIGGERVEEERPPVESSGK